MGYQLIVDCIRDSAEAVNPTGFFVHGRRSDGSLEYNEDFPQIHLYPFTSNPQDANRNLVFADIVMGFWGQDTPETSPEEREVIIAAMDVLSDSFLNELDDYINDEPIEISNVRKEPQYRTLSATLSGYALTFRMKIFESPC